jgi:competence protein ComEC
MGLVVWVALGALAIRCERADVPAKHVTRLVAQAKFESRDPLRWRGRLRSDPVRLPWGHRIEVELEEVEIEGRAVPAEGGLRVSYFRNEKQPEEMPALRAGDHVEALVRARSPRNFQNPGMFDYRGFLARQGIHLTGSLRSVELLQRIEETPADVAHAGARARGWLLARLDALYAGKPDQAAVLRAMLLGDYNFIDRDLAVPFQKTAAYHVLVISGFQVAVLAAMVFWVGRRMRLGLAG